MDSFIFANGSYLNLDHVVSIEPDVDQSGAFVLLHYVSGYSEKVEGDEASTLMAHVRAQPSTGEPGQPVSYPRDAATQAAELAKTLGSSQSRTFDFTDSEGKSRSGAVSKIYGGWVAEVDRQRFEGSSEAGAMSAAMKGAEG